MSPGKYIWQYNTSMQRQLKWKPAASLVILLFSAAALSREDDAFTESVVIFNTVCAKCHEAECSGRLSFDEAFEHSKNHIMRHYGEASGKEWLQRELFDILNYMKGKCAYYPMQAPLPSTKTWKKETLENFSTLMDRNYFIPVGSLQPGNYLVELELERDTRITAHLISADFEMAIEDCFDSRNHKIQIPVQVETQEHYYFRMYPREPARLVSLEITPR